MAVPVYPDNNQRPALRAVPRIRHDNFDTPKVIEDRVRALPEFQGRNEQELWGFIQNEIDYARTNRIGLYQYDTTGISTYSEDWGPGR